MASEIDWIWSEEYNRYYRYSINANGMSSLFRATSPRQSRGANGHKASPYAYCSRQTLRQHRARPIPLNNMPVGRALAMSPYRKPVAQAQTLAIKDGPLVELPGSRSSYSHCQQRDVDQANSGRDHVQGLTLALALDMIRTWRQQVSTTEGCFSFVKADDPQRLAMSETRLRFKEHRKTVGTRNSTAVSGPRCQTQYLTPNLRFRLSGAYQGRGV
jgi:hypothetical protein